MAIEDANYPIGLKIVGFRKMTESELEGEGWETDLSYDPAYAMVLSDGSVIYPSRDYEGNGPGAFFGVINGIQHFALG